MDEQRMIFLVRSAQSGDAQAFGELATHFEGTVFATVLRRLRNRSEALEVTQDVFLQAMRKLGQLRQPERFAGWLRQIARNMAVNRSIRRPPETLRSPETLGAVESAPGDPFHDLVRAEQARALWGGLQRLRELDRRTLIAFYFEGQSLKQMSDEFNSPVGTIKRRLHTARNRLREELVGMQPA